MIQKKNRKIFFIVLFIFILLIFFNLKYFKKKENVELIPQEKELGVYSSNIIKDVKYTTKDNDGNLYTITAVEGEIDYSNPNILYLTKVKALISFANSDKITVVSEFGRYNSENFDTIFSKNVIIDYLNNKITGEYVDFSLERNSMLISKKVIYRNLENILKADVIEINIKTKDTKIFMHEDQKKVNVKSIN